MLIKQEELWAVRSLSGDPPFVIRTVIHVLYFRPGQRINALSER